MVWCINIFHLTWPMSPPYLVKVRCSKLLHNVEMYHLQQSIWRLNYHTVSWSMIYLAELLWQIGSMLWEFVLKMCPHTRTQALRWRRVSLSLAPGKQRFRVLSLPGCHNVETQKIVSGQPVHVWQWPLSKKFVATVCHLHFDTKCEQSVINPVLGKNVEHPRLTR